jgi:hypothetical protein
MHPRWLAPLVFFGSFACSDSHGDSSGEPSTGDDSAQTEALQPLPERSEPPAVEAMTDDDGEPVAPAPVAGAATEEPPFAVFMDPTTGFMTDAVHDADREVVHFDVELGAMVFDASRTAISGWSVTDSDLRWSNGSVPFRVRFGTEDGARRAYFTEAGPGTICNLILLGPDRLSINGTSETPPNP